MLGDKPTTCAIRLKNRQILITDDLDNSSATPRDSRSEVAIQFKRPFEKKDNPADKRGRLHVIQLTFTYESVRALHDALGFYIATSKFENIDCGGQYLKDIRKEIKQYVK